LRGWLVPVGGRHPGRVLSRALDPMGGLAVPDRDQGGAHHGRCLPVTTSKKWDNGGGRYEDRPPPGLAPLPEGCDTQRIAEERREREALDAAGMRRLEELARRPKVRGARGRALDGALERAVERDARRRAAATVVGAEGALVRSGLKRGDVPLDVRFTAGWDAREDDPAFQNATPEGQQRIREAWAEAERTAAARTHRQRAHRRRTILEGCLLFFFLGLVLGQFLGAQAGWTLMAAGPLVGVLWHLGGADRVRHAGIGIGVYFAAVVPWVAAQVLSGGAPNFVFFAFGAMFTGFVCAAHGFREEQRALEGV